MPLRKPRKVPKVPKTRKKSIDKIKEATPAAKKAEIEYRAAASFRYDKSAGKQFFCITVSTVKEFSFLNYTVSLDVQSNRGVIDISILGLNTTQSYLVEPAPASTDSFFEDLTGKFTVNLIKQDGTINAAVYELNVYTREIKLLQEYVPEKKNNRRFCEFSVDAESFSFGGDYARK